MKFEIDPRSQIDGIDPIDPTQPTNFSKIKKFFSPTLIGKLGSGRQINGEQKKQKTKNCGARFKAEYLSSVHTEMLRTVDSEVSQ